MSVWVKQFKYNPLIPLLASGNSAIVYSVKADLLSEPAGSVEKVWNLPIAQRILKKQKPGGYWQSASRLREKYPAVNYDLVETFKQFLKLIDVYRFTREHAAIQRAAEYIFSCQSDEGDLRGFLGNQYAPYYTGLLLSLLIQAGYGEDERIQKGFDWLLSVRQDDGGWVIGSPILFGDYTQQEKIDLISQDVETLKDFDRTRPFAHSGTGMVIRAFAVYPRLRQTEAARNAARLLKSHFFKKDNYSSYQSPENWVRFKYPFWWTDLVSALDSISLIGIPKGDADVSRALTWLVEHQQESGLWKESYSKIHKASENSKSLEARLWITLAICRIFKRYYGE